MNDDKISESLKNDKEDFLIVGNPLFVLDVFD